MEIEKKIEAARENIKNKYRELQTLDQEINYNIQKTYSPIIEPLEELAYNKKKK